MTGELTLLHETARAVLGEIPGADVDDGWSAAGWKALHEAGLTGVGVAERVGGAGGGLVEAAVLLHVAGLAAAPVPIAEATVLGGHLLESAGLGLPDGVLTFARGGRAARRGADWVLTGSLPRVPWARAADHIALLSAAESGPVAALLPAHQCEVTAGCNVAGEQRDRVDLDEVVLPADAIAPVAAPVDEQLELRGALSRVVMMAGAAEATLEQSVRYCAERRQFGKPIAAFQAIQHALARMAGEVAALGAAAQLCVDALADGPSAWQVIGAAKTRSGRAAGSVAAIAHEVHGALGFTREHLLRHHTTRLWAWRDEFGSESEWAARLGAWLLRAGPAALASALADDRLEGGRQAGP